MKTFDRIMEKQKFILDKANVLNNNRICLRYFRLLKILRTSYNNHSQNK
jgi:hypothetical protein